MEGTNLLVLDVLGVAHSGDLLAELFFLDGLEEEEALRVLEGSCVLGSLPIKQVSKVVDKVPKE